MLTESGGRCQARFGRLNSAYSAISAVDFYRLLFVAHSRLNRRRHPQRETNQFWAYSAISAVDLYRLLLVALSRLHGRARRVRREKPISSRRTLRSPRLIFIGCIDSSFSLHAAPALTRSAAQLDRDTIHLTPPTAWDTC